MKVGNKKSRMAELRKRRLELAREQEDRKKRAELGPELFTKIGDCLGQTVKADDFDTTRPDSNLLSRTDDYRSYPGLVAAYVDSRRAASIVECVSEVFGSSDGTLHFSEHSFLGCLPVWRFEPRKLVVLAAALQDEVIFAPEDADGVLAIDFYLDRVSDQENHYSIIVQGEQLEQELAPCLATAKMMDS